MELVSVITPAYNAAATLRRAHDSVRAQTHTAWEHIIVDDGSRDETPALIEELRADTRVRATRVPNGGQASALNIGVGMSRGEYIAFLDADDEYLPEHLSAHLEAMRQQPEVDLLCGGLECIADRYEDTLVPNVETRTGLISVEDCGAQGTLFARRHVTENFRFCEDRAVWWTDYDFVSRVRQRYRVERFHQKTYRYYRNAGNSLIDRIKAEWQRTGTIDLDANKRV